MKKIIMIMVAAIAAICNQGVKAQTAPTSDEINAAILLPGSIVPTWTQPEENPWPLGKNGKELLSQYSRLYFSFTCDKPVILQYYSGTTFEFYDIKEDGNEENVNTHGFTGYVETKLDAGKHDLYIWSRGYESYELKELGIFENDINTDLSASIAQGSLPIEIINDSNNPWYLTSDTTAHNIVRPTLIEGDQIPSNLTFKFTIDKPSVLTWESWYNNREDFYLALDGKPFDNYTSTHHQWKKHHEVFLPGTHTVELETLSNDYYFNDISFRNFKLSDNQVVANVTPGKFSETVIAEMHNNGYDYIYEVESLKLSGSLNDQDWNDMKKMTSLQILDLSNTDITEIPNGQFRYFDIKYVILPETLTTIGDAALCETQLRYLVLPKNLTSFGRDAFNGCNLMEINIPAGIETISWGAFYNCHRLGKITFDEGSKLKLIEGDTFSYNYAVEDIKFPSTLEQIDSRAFYTCTNLKSVTFNEGLETIGSESFGYCDNLTSAYLPKSLKKINSGAFSRCSSLKNVSFPDNLEEVLYGAFRYCDLATAELPMGLKRLESETFTGNPNLTSIRLHSGAKNLESILNGCESLKTIILPCPVPPTLISSDADILNMDKTAISLVVPDFALNEYQTDLYWHQYGSITSSDEISKSDYWRITNPLTLNEASRMQGTPDIEIASNGGTLTINGNTPASFGKLSFDFDAEEYYYDNYWGGTYKFFPAAIINNCDAASATSVEIPIKVKRYQWYFISPMFDVNISDIEFRDIERYAIRYYDTEYRATNGTGDNWKNVTSGVLKAGQGYIIQTGEDGEIVLHGNQTAAAKMLQTGEQTLALADIPALKSTDANWNFIGNPYPAYYDIHYLETGAPITVPFLPYSSYRAMSPLDDDYVLSPMETFFVQKPVDHTTGALFNIAGVQTNTVINRPSNVKASNAASQKRNVFNIEISDADGETSDRTRVVINEEASLDYEMKCDASKFMADTNRFAQIYTIDGEGNRLAINERPLSDGCVDLDVITGDARDYIISASRADGVITLLDKSTGATTDLSLEDFRFNAQPNTAISGRFQLMFAPSISGVENMESARLKAIAGKGYIEVSNPACEQMSIYSADGKIRHIGNESELRMDAEAGIYVVRSNDKAIKLIVR